MVQMHAFYVFLGASGLLAAAFLYVALSTRDPRDISTQFAYNLRRELFFVVLVVLLLGLGMTLGKTPYPKGNELPDKVVFVVGKQFSFGLSDAPITNDQEYEASTYGTPVQVPAGSLIEFGKRPTVSVQVLINRMADILSLAASFALCTHQLAKPCAWSDGHKWREP